MKSPLAHWAKSDRNWPGGPIGWATATPGRPQGIAPTIHALLACDARNIVGAIPCGRLAGRSPWKEVPPPHNTRSLIRTVHWSAVHQH
ncbi:MAG TPA: hypothetical protein VKR06_02560 [Ktedonosporobacter sp.]|nr:hypothetical protein [Ktedonosporobacter sp.]